MADGNRNPYVTLPESAFWKTAVAGRDPMEIAGLWTPKFSVAANQKVVTFGSCFAQHIGRALRARGFTWHITESPPPGLTAPNQTAYNYNLFSCRTGNIYTTSLLKQWVDWALEDAPVPDEYWVSNGRYYDPFRPTIEPNGFESVDEMRASRDWAIAAFRRAITETKFFVFTLGLTESWFNTSKGYEYPLCPGTAAGTFDPDRHEFRNQQFDSVRNNLYDALAKIRSVNGRMRAILTVSPVPLTATNSGRHVLTATAESKAILRAAAGQVRNGNGWVDYFPSYEIVTAPVFAGRFFEPNMRTVSQAGVAFVMNSFFADLNAKFGQVPETDSVLSRIKTRLFPPSAAKPAELAGDTVFPEFEDDAVVCDEQLLEAFGGGA
jgi:hypothetical protein